MSTKSSSDPTVRWAFQSRFGDCVLFDEPLSRHLAYRVGGPADILVFPSNEADLSWLSLRATEFSLPITVIGTGTNLLVLDGGIRGIVVSLARAFRTIEIIPTPVSGKAGATWIRCGAGVQKAELLNWAIAGGLGGLEFSAGVPGTLGGGIFMNAGTKYGCYGDILRELRLYDFGTGGRTVKRTDVHFGYREQTAVGTSLVVSATFELPPGDTKAMQTEVDRIIAERAEKQPLELPSCGSTFKNPEGLSAGRLVERAGLKGTRHGGAVISMKHANFILNTGDASASDILALIGIIKERVYSEFQVRLECEVIILGEEPPEGQVSH